MKKMIKLYNLDGDSKEYLTQEDCQLVLLGSSNHYIFLVTELEQKGILAEKLVFEPLSKVQD